MNRFLFTLLLVTTQPIFCGGVVSCCQGRDQEDDVSTTDDEEPLSRSWQISPEVGFECDPDNGTPRFKIESGNLKFDWEDPQAKGECNALKRRLAYEKDPIKKQLLKKAHKTALYFKRRWDRFRKEGRIV